MSTFQKSQSPKVLNRLPIPLKPVLATTSLVMLTAGSLSVGWRLGTTFHPVVAEASTTTPVAVQTETVSRRSVEGDRTLTGTVEPVEAVTLTSRVQGFVRELRVREGDHIEANQVLAQIDVNDLQAQRSQALAAVNVAQSGYRNARAQVGQAQAQLVEAQAELADARLNQRRMAFLQTEGAVARSVLDSANTKVDVAEAKVGQIQATINQARASIGQTEAQVSQAEASVKQATANLSYGTVVAPFAGVVTRKQVEIGATAGAGQPLLTLESLERLRFNISVPESMISRFQRGQSVQVRIDALNRFIPGVVSQIIPSADPQSRNFVVKISLDSVPNLIPGMFGRLQMTTVNQSTLMIPSAAAVERLGIVGVFKVVDSKAHFQPVTLQKTHDNYAQIFSGLSKGDRVIVNPNPDLLNGAAVRY